MEEKPVLTAAAFVAIGSAIIAVLVAAGVPISDELKLAIVSLLATVAPFAVYWMQKGKTTPLVAPKDEHGNELVRKDTGEPPQKAALYKLKKGLSE